MKIIHTSNWRPRHRAFCTLLCVAALWAMPRSAHTQLYVSQVLASAVGEYNATGGAINTSFILLPPGDDPVAIALSGNTLFVSNFGEGTVGAYNATTGAPIN